MQDTTWLGFALDRSSKTPVFEQICAEIRRRAISGALVEGTALPPTRAFATELGVSRSTVVTAYEQLIAEGYVSSRQGSAYRVCALGEVELNRATPTTPSNPHRVPPPAPPVTQSTHTPMPFEAGQPDMRLFPHRHWAKAVARVCRANPEAMLLGGDRFGNHDLRTAIAAHVSEWRGIAASPDQIFITAGSTDALEICLRTLTSRGDTIGLESPGYPPLHHFAHEHGLSIQNLPLDDQGAQLPDLDPPARLAVLTPSHQYPLGGAMSPHRRLAFLSWAKAADSWIIEDDYDSEFRYAGRPIPAMAGFDCLNRTIYIGSFSKIFSNTLRLGYVISPNELLPQFRETLRRFGHHASYMPQQALADFMTTGEFYRHLRRVRRTYGDRRQFLLEHLRRDFSSFGSFADHHAGMQIVFHLRPEFKDRAIAKRAEEKGVKVQALSTYVAKQCDLNGLILGFCGCCEQEMAPALERLLSCFAESM
ncbi:MocR-like pyridoxine biosynthesis transcription factor PdxR [Aliiroseovarius crassostreae]|uniref:MocR-like pyridoxine biosynthesis transcription factor PdxR n=1 Tax=Aliiroseovarius crassostreae TaxID=154981 RepID=UPI002200841D|nr:PLP-dependent aminotransferase family protein [Aliiroseovarius crassostreae]UWQ07695.1 PLP-dependent aminotransferase family protein [Aliiroseovarius crassostreae]